MTPEPQIRRPALVKIKRAEGENWQQRIMRDLQVMPTVDAKQLQVNINLMSCAGVLSPRYKRAGVLTGHHHLYKPRFHALAFENLPLVFVFREYEWIDAYRVVLRPNWQVGGRRSVTVNCMTARISWGNIYGFGPPTDPAGILMGGLPKQWSGLTEHFVLGAKFGDLEHYPQPKAPEEYRDGYSSAEEGEI